MIIRITCPCGKTFRARDKDAGKRFKCPDCWQLLDVPVPPPLGLNRLPATAPPVPLPSAAVFPVGTLVRSGPSRNGPAAISSRPARRPSPRPAVRPAAVQKPRAQLTLWLPAALGGLLVLNAAGLFLLARPAPSPTIVAVPVPPLRCRRPPLRHRQAPAKPAPEKAAAAPAKAAAKKPPADEAKPAPAKVKAKPAPQPRLEIVHWYSADRLNCVDPSRPAIGLTPEGRREGKTLLVVRFRLRARLIGGQLTKDNDWEYGLSPLDFRLHLAAGFVFADGLAGAAEQFSAPGLATLSFRGDADLHVEAAAYFIVDRKHVEAASPLFQCRHYPAVVLPAERRQWKAASPPSDPPEQAPAQGPPPGTTLKGVAGDFSRNWGARQKVVVIVELPVDTGTFRLAGFSLRQDGGALGACVGLQPPERFVGRVTGSCSQFQTNAPLPVAELRPFPFTKRVPERVLIADVPAVDTPLPAAVWKGLIVGHDLVVHAPSRNFWFVTEPEITYLLYPDGSYNALVKTSEIEVCGVRLPAQRTLRLLFLVSGLTQSTLELVDPEGHVYEVQLAPGSTRRARF